MQCQSSVPQHYTLNKTDCENDQSRAAGPAMDQASSVKSGLLAQLHSAVKACQRRFGGRRELASDSSEACVSNLLTAWENVLNHGLLLQQQQQAPHQQQHQQQQKQQAFSFALHNPQQLLPMLPSSLSHLTSTISATFRGGGPAANSAQPTFWQALQELLSPDEAARFSAAGDSRARCRAWLRERINEASLERFVHTYLADPGLLARHYSPDAFARYADLCAALPHLAAGVNSILFAVAGTAGSSDFAFSDDPSEDDCAIEVAAVAIDEGPSASRNRRRQPPRPVVVSFDDDDAVSSAGSELSINRPDFPVAAASSAAVRPLPLQQPQTSQQQQQQQPQQEPASESGYNTSACSETDASLASAPWFSVTELRQALVDVSRAREREAAERRRAEDQCRALQSQIGQLRRENGLLCQEVGREERLARLAEMHADLSELSTQLQQSLAQAQRELESLRGPSPRCPQYPLYVWIVGAFKKGAGPTRHHVYQIYCQTPAYDWSAFRRYRQFHESHQSLCQLYPDIADFYFPPKVANSLRDEVAKQRMRALQTYLRDVVNYLCAKVQGVTQEQELRQHLPLVLDREALVPRSDT